MISELKEIQELLGDDFLDLYGDFLQDTSSYIESIDSCLAESSEWNEESLKIILAKLHSLKGITGQFGLSSVSKSIHKVEDIFAGFKNKNTMPRNDLIPPLMKFNDVLRLYMESLEGDDATANQYRDNISDLASLKPSKAIAAQGPKNQDIINVKDLKNYNLNQEQFELIFQNLQLLLGKIRAQKGEEPLIKNIESSLFAISSARFIKITPIVKRIESMVTDIASKVGKEIQFEIEGTQTLIDRMIYNSLGEILIHILKNSIDHGIEDQDLRKKKNKSFHGNIKMIFEAHDDKTRIIISDDGKGIDPEIIAKKAIEKNVISPEQSSQMTSYEKQFLIFEPSFSTKDEVSEMSGRGVGMDAVLKEVKKNGGTIFLDSTPDEGTKFIIDYPCAFQMRDTLIWKHGEHLYCMPTTAIRQILIDDREFEEDSGLIRIKETGEEYPLIDLKLGTENQNNYQIVISHIAGIEFSLKVDEIRKVDQLFLRPIAGRHDKIITAMGELADGNPVYYINVTELESNLNQYMITEEALPEEVKMPRGINLSKSNVLEHLNDGAFINNLKEILEPIKDHPKLTTELLNYISEHMDNIENTLEEVEDMDEINYGITIKYASLKSEWIMFNIRIQYFAMAEKPIEEILPYKAAACSAIIEHLEKIIDHDAISKITKTLAEPFGKAA